MARLPASPLAGRSGPGPAGFVRYNFLDPGSRARAAAEADPEVARLETAAIEAGADAEAGAALARFGDQVAGTMNALVRKQAVARREQQVTDALAASTQTLADYRLELDADPDHSTWVARYDHTAAKLRETHMEALGGEAGLAYARRLDSMVLSQRIGLQRKAATRERASMQTRMNAANEGLLADALSAETPVHQETALAQVQDNLNRAVATGVITPEVAQGESARLFGGFEKAQLAQTMQDDPRAALAVLSDPQRLPNIRPFERSRLTLAAQRAVGALVKAEQATVREQVARAYQTLERGDMPAGWEGLVAQMEAFDPERAEDMRRDMAGYQEVMGGGFVQLDPAAQADRILERFGTGPLSPAESHRKELYERVHRAAQAEFARDPVAYLYRRGPVLKGLYDAMDAANEAAASGRGEERLRLGAQASAFDAFLDAQAAAGVPSHLRRVLPERQAKRIAESISAAPPAEVVSMSRGLAARFGEYWPRVYREMVTDHGLTSHYKVLAGMTRPGQEPAAVFLAEAVAVGEKGYRDILPADDIRDMAESLAGEMEDLRTELAYQPGGQRGFVELHESAKLLALKHLAMGEDPDEAAEKAVRALYGDHYRQIDTGEAPFRVPESALPAIDPDPDVALRIIEDGLERAMTTSLEAAIAAGTIDVRHIRPQSADQSQAEVIAQYGRVLQTQGRWVTNPEETGVVLTDPLGQAVRRTDGELYEYTWPELAARDLPPDDMADATRKAVASTRGPTESDDEFDLHLAAAHQAARQFVPEFAILPTGPKIALVKLAFDAGAEAIAENEALLAAIAAGDWEAAAAAIVTIPAEFLGDIAAIEAAEFMILGTGELHRDPPFEMEWEGGVDDLKGGQAGDAFMDRAAALSRRIQAAVRNEPARAPSRRLSTDEISALTEALSRLAGIGTGPREPVIGDRRGGR